MNNRVYIIGARYADGQLVNQDEVYEAVHKVCSAQFFDQYGSAKLSERYGFFGFHAIFPQGGDFAQRRRWAQLLGRALRLLHCSTVYIIRDAAYTRDGRFEIQIARMFNKGLILR